MFVGGFGFAQDSARWVPVVLKRAERAFCALLSCFLDACPWAPQQKLPIEGNPTPGKFGSGNFDLQLPLQDSELRELGKMVIPRFNRALSTCFSREAMLGVRAIWSRATVAPKPRSRPQTRLSNQNAERPVHTVYKAVSSPFNTLRYKLAASIRQYSNDSVHVPAKSIEGFGGPTDTVRPVPPLHRPGSIPNGHHINNTCC